MIPLHNLRKTKLHQEQSGQILVLTLILLILGMLIITPLLAFMATGLNTNQVYDDNTAVIYAADAGIEDAKWKIEYDQLALYQFDFTNPLTYYISSEAGGEIGEDINGYPARIDIHNVWIPGDPDPDLNFIDTPDSSFASNIISSQRLTVSGTTKETGIEVDNPDSANPGDTIQISRYNIRITYWLRDDNLNDLKIEKIGLWLPGGYEYFSDSSQEYAGEPVRSQLESLDPPFRAVPQVYYPCKGNQMIVWQFETPPAFTDSSFPNSVLTVKDSYYTLEFSLFYRPLGQGYSKPNAVAWVDTVGIENLPFSWDSHVKVYRLESTVEDMTAEAYITKSELPGTSSAVAGDYFATGNTLMRNAHSDSGHIRDTWLNPDHSSSAEVTAEDLGEAENNPVEIAAAYLYWTGWKSKSTLATIWEESCQNLNEWDVMSSGTQYLIPVSDGDSSGNWDPFPVSPGTLYDKVDETSPNDNDYIIGSTNEGGYQLFNFNPFFIPVDLPVQSLTIYYRARDSGSGGGRPPNNNSNNIRPSIKVGGQLYHSTGNSTDPDSSWSGNTFSHPYTVNPATGSPWTVEDINGTSPYPLQQFGVYSIDLNPDIRVSMVYARVDYGYDSLWSAINGRFHGRGNSSASIQQRTLTMKNSLDLSSFAPGTVSISWSQSESGQLEPDDTLYYAFSGDGGNTWSDNLEAFHDDSPASPLSISVPDEYLTTSFMLRFYFGFDSSDEHVYIDNIEITTELFTDTCSNFNHWRRSETGSRWSIDSNRFQGRGSSSGSITSLQRELTLLNSIDLSPYQPGTVVVSWEQTVSSGWYSDNLEPEDKLFFAFYNDEYGWSNNIEALRGGNTNRYFAYQVPDHYLTSSFKMRFYFNFNSDNEYVYIDNITVGIMSPDRSVFFKINDQQVYFNGVNPAAGPYEITASRAEIIPSITSGVFDGYSYSCFRDVTALVRKYTRVDEGEDTEHSPGIATYTVGNVDATLGIDGGDYQLAHAGWSLILIYTSPKTVGHQLYLFDRFTYADDYKDLDFDRDGNPGGTISGFIVPERIEIDGMQEEYVAKMTVFVGEGDEWIENDFIAFQAPEEYRNDTYDPRDIPDRYKLWDGIDAGSNSRSSPDNVWNGESTVFTADGIDVDTFYIPWDMNIPEEYRLSTGDTSAHIDIYTEQDNWNMIYIIISFRSKTTYGNTLSYMLHN